MSAEQTKAVSVPTLSRPTVFYPERLYPSTAGSRLRLRRLAMHRTQVSASEGVPIAPSSLYTYENDTYPMKVDDFIKYARWLGLYVVLVDFDPEEHPERIRIK